VFGAHHEAVDGVFRIPRRQREAFTTYAGAGELTAGPKSAVFLLCAALACAVGAAAFLAAKCPRFVVALLLTVGALSALLASTVVDCLARCTRTAGAALTANAHLELAVGAHETRSAIQAVAAQADSVQVEARAPVAVPRVVARVAVPAAAARTPAVCEGKADAGRTVEVVAADSADHLELAAHAVLAVPWSAVVILPARIAELAARARAGVVFVDHARIAGAVLVILAPGVVAARRDRRRTLVAALTAVQVRDAAEDRIAQPDVG
jgi:hypothetical protein